MKIMSSLVSCLMINVKGIAAVEVTNVCPHKQEGTRLDQASLC